MITPEIAAQVVRDFLLPMFDVEGRKSQKAKETSGGAVYKELVLSQLLAEQLAQMRNYSDE